MGSSSTLAAIVLALLCVSLVFRYDSIPTDRTRRSGDVENQSLYIDCRSPHRRALSLQNDGETADRRFMLNALRVIGNHSDIVFFNGIRAKAVFDTNNPLPHFLMSNKLWIKAWKSIAQSLNVTYEEQLKISAVRHYKAVHMHNELQAGDLLLTVLEEYRRNKLIRFPKEAQPVNVTAADIHRTMDLYQPPVVITNTIDENWGFLSTVIVNRTTKWINMTNHLRLHYSNHNTMRIFLDSPKIAMMFVSSHVDPEIGYHEKVISLPLGIKARQNTLMRARMILALDYRKTKLLTINNSGWGPRTMINEMVSKAFNYTVKNSYDRRARNHKKVTFNLYNSTEQVTVQSDHYLEIAQSKFVLCPSGLGFDTYRMWEVILLGSIPVIESNPGLDRTVASLPVMIVKSFSDLTPELLESAYPCFVKHADEFKFAHLREDYWLSIIRRTLETARTDHIMEHHPFRHKYCSFV